MTLLLDDRDVAQIGHDVANDCLSMLRRLPPNWMKTREHVDQTPQQGAESNDTGQTLSAAGVNKYLTCASAIMNLAVKRGWSTVNPFSGLQLPDQKSPQEQRQPFSDEDLRRLFDPVEYRKRCKAPWLFWIPILALWTGARAEEIAQLYVEDVYQSEGHWVVDINDMGDDKWTKTISSVRIVPLSDVVVDLGFIQYVQSLKTQRVFPRLRKIQDKYSKAVTRWFNEIMRPKYIQIGPGEKKSFHSFRHTFITTAKRCRVDLEVRKELAGHAAAGETDGRYSDRYGAADLYELGISKIKFPSVDWEKLSAFEAHS